MHLTNAHSVHILQRLDDIAGERYSSYRQAKRSHLYRIGLVSDKYCKYNLSIYELLSHIQKHMYLKWIPNVGYVASLGHYMIFVNDLLDAGSSS